MKGFGPALALAVLFFLGGLGIYINAPRPQKIEYQEYSANGETKNNSFDVTPIGTDERIASYTLWLTIFTGVLGLATIGLFWVTDRGIKNQSRDTRILQRAYLSVDLGGVKPYVSGAELISFDVVIRNTGNLPAANVAWFIDKRFSGKDDLPTDAFNIASTSGSVIVPPRGVLRKGGKAISFAEFDAEAAKVNEVGRGPWMYVFGKIEYRDGFVGGRYIVFCHRYNLRGARERRISAGNGRHHEHGNYTDES